MQTLICNVHTYISKGVSCSISLMITRINIFSRSGNEHIPCVSSPPHRFSLARWTDDLYRTGNSGDQAQNQFIEISNFPRLPQNLETRPNFHCCCNKSKNGNAFVILTVNLGHLFYIHGRKCRRYIYVYRNTLICVICPSFFIERNNDLSKTRTQSYTNRNL